MTARLSAYYEVRVVMLEPEPPRTMPGLVLNLGTFLLQLGSPHLERSQSQMRFKIPDINGGSIQEIEATPAALRWTPRQLRPRRTIDSCCSARTLRRVARDRCFSRTASGQTFRRRTAR